MTSRLKAEALREEISSLLQKGAISVVPKEDRNRGFYSHYFLVPKSTGGMRPILDLRVLNRCIATRPFRMLTVKRVLRAVRVGDSARA